jgi:PIN domain nuclease of toxin-antitoxin system
MKLLLDTCVFLWLMLDSKKISPTLREVLANPANRRYLSAASVWEAVVKWHSGKLGLPKPPAEFFAETTAKGRIRPLPVEGAAVLQLAKLPKMHNDPFDRMLICQAIENGMTIVTPDELIGQYPIKTLWL